MKALYHYVDYRAYLKDYYHSQKESDPGYSHRVMSAQMGFTSPNYLKLVMDGERNLSPQSLEKVKRGLRLKKKEGEYFSFLVAFNQAKSSEEKNRYFGLISKYRSKSNVTEIAVDQFEYYTHWYNPVIRELVAGRSVDLDYKKLAKEVMPPILPKQAKNSLELLLRLNLLKVVDNHYQFSSSLIATARDIQSLSIRNFHRQMCGIAKESLDAVPPDQRDFSSVTVNVSDTGLKKLKTRLTEFREELMQIVKEDVKTKGVYQVNFQVFPLSKKGVEKGSEHE